MKHVKLLALIALLTLNLDVYGQWGQLVRLILRDGTRSGDRYIVAVPRYTGEYLIAEKQMLRELANTPIGTEIQSAHPGTNFHDIQLSSEDYRKIALYKRGIDDNHRFTDEKWTKVVKTVSDKSFMERLIKERKTARESERSNVKTYVSMPSSEVEYRNIFDTYNPQLYTNVLNIRNQIHQKQPEVMFLASAQDLRNALGDGGVDPIQLIGHNEEGLFRFPDKTTMSISEIEEIAVSRNRIVIFLTCNASNYTSQPAVNVFLNYAEAVNITNYLQSRLKEQRGPFTDYNKTFEERIQRIINDYLAAKKLNYRLKVLAVGSAVGGAGYVLYEVKKETKPGGVTGAGDAR